jgi:arylsulfatase A-like enzyme
LAAESVLYERAISPAAWTLPSHASLFTGLYVSQHGTHFGHPYLRNDFVTLAELLQDQGYETAAFSTNDWVNEKFGFNRGFNTFRWVKRTMEWLNPLFPHETKLEKVIRYLRDPIYPVGYRNNRLLKEWILNACREERPFFAYTLYFEPHYPYRPQYPYAWKYLKGQSRPWWRVNLDPDRFMAGAVRMSPEDWETINALYDSRIASTDAMIGRLIQFLRSTHVLDNTVVIIVADHGENLGEHGLMSHQYCVYDTLVHVPLIIRYPPEFQANQRVSDLVQTLEIYTTVLDILGIDKRDIPNPVQGRTLIPEKLHSDPPPAIISEYLAPNLARMRRLYRNYDTDRYDRTFRAIRRDNMKAIFASDGQAELYDLTSDPGETRNLAKQMPNMVQEMQSHLRDWLISVGASESTPIGGDNIPEIDPALVRRLEYLGYF